MSCGRRITALPELPKLVKRVRLPSPANCMHDREDNVTTRHFITEIIETDLRTGSFDRRICTRFPPEPNGYLHIGHIKAIALSFDMATRYDGLCNLRFDDTNPERESSEYVDMIMRDIRWLGFDWGDRLFFASDYFGQFYEYALQLTRAGVAYVDSLSPDDIRAYRGTPTTQGKNSPYRNRSRKENIDLLERMRKGEYPEGHHVLRAKIDMAHPNLTMRDPTIYRIRHVKHHRAGDAWHIYPMYDFAHCLSDAIEGVTHSLCTLEFEDHRPLYNWFLDMVGFKKPPKQIEFARLNISHTMLSKRRLAALIRSGHVSGWDDPCMPTIAGMRRRGYPAEALLAFCRDVGVTKVESCIDMAHLEHFLRDTLNAIALRVMVVLHPLRVVIENWPADVVDEIEAENNPEDPRAGTRFLPFSRILYIEHDDFHRDPPPKYFRLAPGREIRLKHAYYITCTQVIENEDGEVIELRCSYDPASRGGHTPDGRKVKGALHWVSADHALDATVRLYDRLTTIAEPDSAYTDPASEEIGTFLNPNVVEALAGCKMEPSLGMARPGVSYQFMRQGYFCLDEIESRDEAPVFNRTVELRDDWKRISRNRDSV